MYFPHLNWVTIPNYYFALYLKILLSTQYQRAMLQVLVWGFSHFQNSMKADFLHSVSPH